MKGLLKVLFYGLWIAAVCRGIYSNYAPGPKSTPPTIHMPRVSSPSTSAPDHQNKAQRTTVIPDPDPPKPGQYRAKLVGKEGERLGDLDIYLPASPYLNQIKYSNSQYDGLSTDISSVAGWIAAEEDGRKTFYPARYRAWVVVDREKMLLLEIQLGDGRSWITERTNTGFSGMLEGGQRLFIKHVGNYDRAAIDAMGQDSMQRLQAQWEEADTRKDENSSTWAEETLSATKELLSYPEVQEFLGGVIRSVLEAKFGNGATSSSIGGGASTRSRTEPVNPNQHTVRRRDGSTYQRTNPDRNISNNINPSR